MNSFLSCIRSTIASPPGLLYDVAGMAAYILGLYVSIEKMDECIIENKLRKDAIKFIDAVRSMDILL